MSIAHQRKKQPESVRRQLLDEAARIALEHGLAGLTLQAVAREAGVSKGGLLHHFPSKHALLEAMCDEFLRRLDGQIAALMEQDPVAHGRFARAYLDAMSSTPANGPSQRWAVFSVMLQSEPALRQRWHEWVSKRLYDDAGGKISVAAWIVWFATDGLWLSDRLGNPRPDKQERLSIIARLRAETYQQDGCCIPPQPHCEAQLR
ncbi:TetR/AcrR family transcriptional regulator, partial [Kerstersia sp.]|uniref:TetR/AcrR family transcriptional regulator n=1 Tax=Kerstersia sp. TaxID=1930783 RepID=UPI003F93D7DC